MLKSVLSRLKPLLRGLILGGTLFFLVKVLKDHWAGVAAIRVSGVGGACLAIALGLTLLAHICAGWVWSQMLRRDFRQPIQTLEAVQAYLQTTIAKYLPGNIWHYYGRITAATQAGASLETATVSVLLEPLLMAAAALLVALLGGQAIAAQYGSLAAIGLWGLWGCVLLGLHPKILNRLLGIVGRLKTSSRTADPAQPFQLERYLILPLIGELGFLLLRSAGFLLTFLALSPVSLAQLPLLLSGFSVAWLLGLVVPGAPGGVGVFEATVIALLNQQFPPSILLGTVALYRLISVAAEALGASLSWLDQQRSR